MAQIEIVYSDAINLEELAFRACFEHGVEDEVKNAWDVWDPAESLWVGISGAGWC